MNKPTNPILIEHLKPLEASETEKYFKKAVIDWFNVIMAVELGNRNCVIQYAGYEYEIERDVSYCFKQMRNAHKWEQVNKFNLN